MERPDPRFFEPLGPVALGALVGPVFASTQAPDLAIEAVSILANAGPGDIAFFNGDRRYAEEARATRASACYTPEKGVELLPKDCVPVVTFLPQWAWAATALSLHRPRRHDPASGAVDPTAKLEEGVSLGIGAVVGAGAEIGAGTHIGPGAVIGPGVAIGRNCVIGPNVVIGFALIGDGVTISAGTVIGEPGFGVTISPKGAMDVPQLGRVILQDGVSVGANTTIDRGAFDDTVIGENTKIDNLVQIAHNVRIGRNCVLAAFTGISGSVTIGDGGRLGGRVGVADHVNIGSGVQLAAAAAVMRDVPDGETWGGYPARPAKGWLREVAWLTRQATGLGRRGRS
jgi:UDP-3-O-[3-hydroxymyristoyl] glucosamine N-acyltransferase